MSVQGIWDVNNVFSPFDECVQTFPDKGREPWLLLIDSSSVEESSLQSRGVLNRWCIAQTWELRLSWLSIE